MNKRKYIITAACIDLQLTANFYCNNKQTALQMANVYFTNEFSCNVDDLQILNVKAVY